MSVLLDDLLINIIKYLLLLLSGRLSSRQLLLLKCITKKKHK